jgi:uncharacterized protein
MTDAHEKTAALDAILTELGAVTVAFSGGVDSTFLLHAAARNPRVDTTALTAVSALHPDNLAERTKALAARLGVKHRLVETTEMDEPAFVANTAERCFVCKKKLFAQLIAAARKNGWGAVVEGGNKDDERDFRPGRRALRLLGVRAPLAEAGWTKAEIRRQARAWDIPNWDQPAAACLASRIAYGQRITVSRLQRIERSERFLQSQGFGQVRVRDHGAVARIEVAPAQIALLTTAEMRLRVAQALKARGFTYVTVDLQGYRTGALNEALTASERRAAEETTAKQSEDDEVDDAHEATEGQKGT